MLYPIELLRRKAGTQGGASENGEHVNDPQGVCHAVLVCGSRRPRICRDTEKFPGHAKCNA